MLRFLLAAILVLPAATGGLSVPTANAKTKMPKQKPLDESNMNCKQLSGRVQVMLLEARDYGSVKSSSALSRNLQSVFVATTGNMDHGMDPDAEHAANIKKLRDFNQRLVDMGCKSYDIDYELQQKDPTRTPAATVSPPKKSKPAEEPAQKP